MHCVHVIRIGNLTAAVDEYRRRFPRPSIRDRRLHHYVLFTDEKQFTRREVTNIRNSRLWA